MQAFYLSRNQHGYFGVRFSDPVSGKLGQTKSTHTKNRQQATLIADEWCRNGVPAGRSCERSLSVVNSGVDLVALKEKIEPDRTIVAIDGKTMCDSNKVTGSVVLFASVNPEILECHQRFFQCHFSTLCIFMGFIKTRNQDMAGACRPPRPEIKNLRYRYL